MKKLDRRSRDQRSRLAASRFENRQRRKGKHYRDSDLRLAQKGSVFSRSVVIPAPEHISIYEFSEDAGGSYSSTVSFIKEILSNFGKRSVVLDFSETQRITAAALIVVYASIDEAGKNGLCKGAIVWPKSSPHSSRIIRKSNIPRLLRREDIAYKFESLEMLPVITGVGNEHLEDVIDYILRSTYSGVMSPETEYAYGDAVSETLNNVGLHAYPGKDVAEKRWWLLCETFGAELYLAVYDAGVGIPKTVVDRPWFLASLAKVFPGYHAELRSMFEEFEAQGWKAYVPTKIPDANLISLSMQGDVTGTRKSKHGQGSKSIKALVESTTNGKLWVFSRSGLYTFEDEIGGSKLFKLPVELPGTLVQWNIQVR